MAPHAGQNVDGNLERFLGRFGEPAFDPHAPRQHFGHRDGDLHAVVGGGRLDLRRCGERRAETDMTGGGAGPCRNGDCESPANTVSARGKLVSFVPLPEASRQLPPPSWRSWRSCRRGRYG